MREAQPQSKVQKSRLVKSQRQMCEQCLIIYFDMQTRDDVKAENQAIIEQFETHIKNNSALLYQLISFLIQQRETFLKQIETIDNTIKNINNEIQKSQNALAFQDKYLQKQDLIIKQEQFFDGLKKFQKATLKQLELLKQHVWIDKSIQNLKELNQLGIISEKENVYELITSTSLKQTEECWAISFNRNSSLTIAGCNKKIKIFEFKNDKLIEIQQIIAHDLNVTCLQFMKKSNSFVSGGQDASIKVWNFTQDCWTNTKTLKYHLECIQCIVINSNDDLVISGSRDQFICFWKQKNDEWELNQKIKCSSIIWSLSINDSNTKLISSEDNRQIQVIDYQNDIWKIVQSINIANEGYRLCFLSDYQFAYQPILGKNLQFYYFNFEAKEYKLGNEVEVKNNEKDLSVFPIIFVKSKNLIIAKNCNFVNILSKQNNGIYSCSQSIQFQTSSLYGSVSHDGQYLMTWDCKSREFQIREFKLIQ